MTEPVSLAERRWANGDHHPDKHTVRDCLEVVMAKITSGEQRADHIVIAVGWVDDEQAGNDAYYQAGTFRPFEQIGLLERVKMLMMGLGR